MQRSHGIGYNGAQNEDSNMPTPEFVLQGVRFHTVYTSIYILNVPRFQV